MQWDYIVIGSGFGGSVCGLRLTEKGYRVLMLEQGRRLGASDFPHTNWRGVSRGTDPWYRLLRVRKRGPSSHTEGALQ